MSNCVVSIEQLTHKAGDASRKSKERASDGANATVSCVRKASQSQFPAILGQQQPSTTEDARASSLSLSLSRIFRILQNCVCGQCYCCAWAEWQHTLTGCLLVLLDMHPTPQSSAEAIIGCSAPLFDPCSSAYIRLKPRQSQAELWLSFPFYSDWHSMPCRLSFCLCACACVCEMIPLAVSLFLALSRLPLPAPPNAVLPGSLSPSSCLSLELMLGFSCLASFLS